MSGSAKKITVFYDGSCPSCVQDRKDYERRDPGAGAELEWFDITDRDQELIAQGIDPHKALTELHIRYYHWLVTRRLRREGRL